jgi:hypothetical protein
MDWNTYVTRDVNSTPFHLNIAPSTVTLAYPIKYSPESVIVPYTRKEKSTIDTKFSLVKNYFDTWKNIYQACYDMLDIDVNNAFKVAPTTTPPTTGWNATMSLHNIFDQLATTYGKPSPDTMHQNNLEFWLRTINKTPLSSCSSNAPIARRLQP